MRGGGAGRRQNPVPGSCHCPCPRPRWGGRDSDSLLVEALGGSSQSCHCLPSFPYPPWGRSRAPSSRGGPGFGEILGAPRRKNGHSQALDVSDIPAQPTSLKPPRSPITPDTKPEQGLSAPCPVPLLADCSRQAAGREAERKGRLVWLLQVHAPKPGTRELCPSFQPACHSQTTQQPCPQKSAKSGPKKLEKNQYILLAKS